MDHKSHRLTFELTYLQFITFIKLQRMPGLSPKALCPLVQHPEEPLASISDIDAALLDMLNRGLVQRVPFSDGYDLTLHSRHAAGIDYPWKPMAIEHPSQALLMQRVAEIWAAGQDQSGLAVLSPWEAEVMSSLLTVDVWPAVGEFHRRQAFGLPKTRYSLVLVPDDDSCFFPVFVEPAESMSDRVGKGSYADDAEFISRAAPRGKRAWPTDPVPYLGAVLYLTDDPQRRRLIEEAYVSARVKARVISSDFATISGEPGAIVEDLDWGQVAPFLLAHAIE